MHPHDQVTVRLPFTLEVMFESRSEMEQMTQTSYPTPLSGSVFDSELKQREEMFDEKFERVFHLKVRSNLIIQYLL